MGLLVMTATPSAVTIKCEPQSEAAGQVIFYDSESTDIEPEYTNGPLTYHDDESTDIEPEKYNNTNGQFYDSDSTDIDSDPYGKLNPPPSLLGVVNTENEIQQVDHTNIVSLIKTEPHEESEYRSEGVCPINTQPVAMLKKEVVDIKVDTLECEYCDQTFNSSSCHQQHESAHRVGNMFTCLLCPRRVKFASLLKTHTKIHSNTMHVCDICGTEHRTEYASKVHKLSHDITLGLACTKCGKRFIAEPFLKKHSYIHTNIRLHPCSFCEQRFRYASHLIKHIRTHTGERPFACSFCDKGFKDRCELTRHLRIHTGEKPYQCELCDRQFTDVSCLHAHKPTHMTPEERLQNAHHCHLCSKKFLHYTGLTRHMRVHVQGNTHICLYCDKRYKTVTQLKKHKLTCKKRKGNTIKQKRGRPKRINTSQTHIAQCRN